MQIQTVCGPIDPSSLGITLTHEHVRMDYRSCQVKPLHADHKAKMHDNQITLKNLGFVRQHPYSHVFNLAFGDEGIQTMIDELKEYKRLGGDSLVEVTTFGIRPDYEFLKTVSEEANVHIVCSTGYYLGHTLSEEVKNSSVDDLIKNMVNDLTIGRNGIRAGCIGEIGCQYPLVDCERKSLIAAAKTQAQIGCPLIIHPGRNEKAPFEIIDILAKNGADISKTVMSHLDRTLCSDTLTLQKFASYSTCYLEFDLFGMELLHYPPNPSIDFPSDSQRIQMVKLLIDTGHEDRIVIAHDIHTRHRLIKYGGHGYGHILEHIIPKMLARGIKQNVIDKILIENPKRWLAY